MNLWDNTESKDQGLNCDDVMTAVQDMIMIGFTLQKVLLLICGARGTCLSLMLKPCKDTSTLILTPL